MVDSYERLLQLLQQKNVSIRRLRTLVFGPTTETTRKVLQSLGKNPEAIAALDRTGQVAAAANSDGDSGTASEPDGDDAKATDPAITSHQPAKGHGRHGAADYSGAEHISVPHQSLKPGDKCPGCDKGHVRKQKEPAPFVHFFARPPIDAKVFDLEVLRCDACGKLFTARAPEHTGQQKYDITAPAMIGLLRYGAGMPHNRLGKLQSGLGIPLPPSTQWEVIKPQVEVLKPVFDELIRQGAQGELLHNDDTSMTVLSLVKEINQEKERKEQQPDKSRKQQAPERTGVFTTNVLSMVQGRQVALFFTGRRHAGENIASVLAHRNRDLAPPLQMCDGLDRNLPKELKTIVSNCLTHSRRKYVEVAEYFPVECLHVLDVLAKVYKNDALARRDQMSPDQRLLFHQQHSGSLMNDLKAWIEDQLDSHKVEANGNLGEAMSYMLKRWERLTLFLHQPGAPLDNSICERALKKAVIHRKNSLFYKTENGAQAGDIFMSLIHTAELNGVKPFDYLVALLSHPNEIKQHPELWLPWNYRQTLDSLEPRQSAPPQAA